MLKFKWETEFRETEIGFEIPSEWEEKLLRDDLRNQFWGQPSPT